MLGEGGAVTEGALGVMGEAGIGADGALKIGVVGVGVMGSNHARVLSEMSNVRLVGIADPDRKQRDFVARTLGCAAFGDLDSLLDCGLDAVTIAAPTHLHHDLALDASARGVHSWSRSRSRRRWRKAARSSPPPAAPASRSWSAMSSASIRRSSRSSAAIKDEDILSIAITSVGPFPPRMSNVGVVIDLAVHDIDLIRWFTDSEIAEIQPQISSAVAEREDIALLQFRTASGVLAHINTNWLTPFKARTIHVATRNKYLIGDLLTLQVTECFGFQPDGSYSMRHLSVGYAEPLRSELLAFVNAIRSGRTPAVTGEEGLRASRSRSVASMHAAASSTVPQRKGPRRVVG